MTSALELAALLIASAFTSAAFYINFAEHPARMKLPTSAALMQWKPAYKAGFVMQATLAMLGGAAAIAVAVLDGDWVWAIGGVTLILNWPYTLLVMLPLNNKLMAIETERAGEDVRGMLARWNRLHSGRTLLGALATLLMIFATRT
ncbi:MAG: DUF1772 domain-containing protein [Hyphomonadaceae bacterium]